MDIPTFAEEIRVPFRMSVASKSNSGKTHLVSQLVQELLKQGKIYIAFVQSNTYGLNDDYSFLPAKCKSRFDPQKLEAGLHTLPRPGTSVPHPLQALGQYILC